MARKVERRELRLRGPEPYVMTNGEAEMAMEALADRPRSLQPSEIVPFDPAEAQRAAAAWSKRRALRSDSLVRLYEAGHVRAAELRAGQEIRTVMRWRHGEFSALSQNGGYMEKLAGSTDMEDVPFGFYMACVEAQRYEPWIVRCQDLEPVKKRPLVGVLTLIEAVLLRDLGMRQAADDFRVDQRRALRLIRRALHAYAVIAGWVMESEPGEMPG